MNKGKFNPKVGHGFSNNKFGEGSVLVRIDAEGLAAITENLQIGGSILLKYNKVTEKGNKHYFVEILPPYAPSVGAQAAIQKQAKAGKKTTTTSAID